MTTFKLISEYDNYFAHISYDYTIKNFEVIIHKFKNYLNDIIFLRNGAYLFLIIQNNDKKTSYDNIIKPIQNNIDIIINFYSKISNEIKKQYITLNYEYYTSIFNGIMILYQYYYLINKYESYNKKQNLTLSSSNTSRNLKLISSLNFKRTQSFSNSLKMVQIHCEFLLAPPSHTQTNECQQQPDVQ